MTLQSRTTEARRIRAVILRAREDIVISGAHAIVYSTDATPQVRDQLQIIQVPDPLQTLATYPIAVAKGNNAAGGEAFVAYVLGPDGQATLAKWGFLPPP